MTKKALAVILSKLQTFKNPKEDLEQYPTDSEIAAEILWDATLADWIQNKTVLDLGAGTGILGLGCALLQANKVIFVEKDEAAIAVLKENIQSLKQQFDIPAKFIILNQDFLEYNEKVDFVVQNPPFGTRNKGIDTQFLEKAFSLSKKILTIHKFSTEEYIKTVIRSYGYKIVSKRMHRYPLKQSMLHHTHRIHRIDTTAFLLEKE